MKNLKILLVIFATFSLGLSNNVFGGAYAASSGIQYVQNIITQFTTQTNIRIIDPNRDQVVNIDYLKNVLNELYSKGFNWDLSDPNIRQQIATAIWNAITPTVNNYAKQAQYINNQEAYKTLVWNSVTTLLLELVNTTFKDINRRVQASKTPAARPVRAQQQPQQQSAAQQGQTIATTLSDIMNGSFGNDYAKKVKEIVEFDYSQAQQLGFSDLRTMLEQSVNQVNSNPAIKPAGKIDSIKKIINSLYEDFSKYPNLKATTSPVKTAPSMVFTLDLILRGALGGEYAKKAKEINSFDYTQSTQVGFAPLSGVLQQDIARINADKSPQATKVANLKAVIDSLHKDLNKVYRDLKRTSKPAVPTAAPVGSSAKQPLPNWISNDNTLKNKEFETALLNYIFKNQNASEKDIQNYFSQQVPKDLPKRSNLISAMNKLIKNNFGDAQKRASRQSMAPSIATTTSTATATPKTTTTTKTSTPTTPAAKPKPQGTFGMPVAEIVKRLPAWINRDTYGLNVDDFKPVLAQYIAQNKNAQDKDIIKHFDAQIPTEFPFRNDVINSIKNVLKTQKTSLPTVRPTATTTGTRTRTSTPTKTTTRTSARVPSQRLSYSSQLLNQLPEWVNKDTLEIDQNNFNRAVNTYVQGNINAENEDIIKHFRSQIPAALPFLNKDSLFNEIESALEEYYYSISSPVSTASPTTTIRTTTRLSTPTRTTTRTSTRVPSQRLSLSSKLLNQLPEWIDKDSLAIDQNKFNKAVGKYVQGNINAENEDIIKHFSDQIPSTIVFKAVLIEDIKSALDEFYNQ